MDRRAVLRALGGSLVAGGVLGSGTRRTRGAASEHGGVSLPEGYDHGWDASLSGMDSEYAYPVLGADRVYVVGRRIRAFDRDGGDRLWETDPRGEWYLHAAVHGGRVYAYGGDGTLVARDAASGDAVWERSLGDGDGARELAADDRGVAVVDGTGAFALERDGGVEWERALEDDPTEAVVAGDALACRTLDGEVWALDRVAGDREWSTGWSPGPTQRGMAGADDGWVALSHETGVVAVDPDGEARYLGGVEAGRIATRPAVRNRRVYVTARREAEDDGSATDSEAVVVRAFPLTEGDEGWREPVPVDDCLPVDRWETWPVPTANHVYTGADECVGVTGVATGESVGRVELPSRLASVPAADPDALVATTRDRVVAVTAPDCDPPAVADGDAEFSFPVPNPRALRLSARVRGGNCPWAGRLEAVVGDAVATTVPLHLPTDRPVTVEETDADASVPRGHERLTYRLRRRDGALVDERTVPFDDYRNQPADFRIVCHDREGGLVAPGEAVTATLTVRNYGYEGDYVARLVGDGETLTEERGTVPAFRDDDVARCDGTDVPLTHAFDESGTYHLTGVVEPRGDEGSGDRVDLGRVLVGGPLSRLGDGALVGGGLATGTGLGAAYWWSRGD